MHFFNQSLSSPAENLALEDTWLEMAEEGQWNDEILRIWEPTSSFVVIGRGSRIAEEVNLGATQAANIPVLRRVSGGAAIVAARGCAMYAVLLSYEKRPHLRMLDQAHGLVMRTMVAGLQSTHPDIAWDGTCDLTLNACKVSGNSLRCRRNWMLYHGTLLLDMDLTLVDQFLLHPPREPEYRQKRQHGQFVTNLGGDWMQMRRNICEAWGIQYAEASSTDVPVPTDRIAQLVSTRYSNDEWTMQR